jgi:hypothetical protein
MTKNIIIAGLAFSNLILMAALIYVCVQWRKSPAIIADTRIAAPTQATDVEAGPQEFTFKAPGSFVGDDAPPIANRALIITATFDTQAKDGVIISQGGLAHGYSLYVHEGELLFAVRRANVLTTVSGGKVSAGRQTVTATLSKSGKITLARDRNAPVTGLAAGAITMQPVSGLDIGSDRGAPVGPYEMPNTFGGTIEHITLKTEP